VEAEVAQMQVRVLIVTHLPGTMNADDGTMSFDQLTKRSKDDQSHTYMRLSSTSSLQSDDDAVSGAQSAAIVITRVDVASHPI